MSLIAIDSKLMILIMKLQEKKYSTLDELAKDSEVSTRTIRNYIKQINGILHKDMAQIVSYKDKRYGIEVYDELKFSEFQQQYLNNKGNFKWLVTPNDRTEYLVRKFVVEEGTFKTDDLAEEMNISRTTLINDIKRISDVMGKFSLQVKGKTNEGISLQGSEINKRLFFLYFFYNEFKEETISFNNNLELTESDYRKLKIKLKDVFKSNNYKISEEGVRSVISFVVVLLIRLKQKKYIKKLEEKHKQLTNTEDFKMAQVLANNIENDFNVHIPENEVIFLTLPLMGRSSPIRGEEDLFKVNPNVNKVVKLMFKQIYDEMGLDLMEDKEAYIGLEYHLNFAMNRILFNLPINNPLLEDIKKYYPFPYALAKISAEVIERFYDVKVIEDEVGYIALHFGSYVERRNSKYFSITKIALVCGTGLGTAKLLEIKLRKLLGSDKKIDIYSDSDVTEDLLKSYDIVFTTVDLTCGNVPVIKLTAIFSDNEIIKEIEKKYKSQKYKLSYDESKRPFVHLSVPEEQLFILNEESYLSSIERMVDGLSKVTVLDRGLKERLLEREMKSSTAFDNYVGLPHAVNYGSEKFILSIGVLQKPVLWGSNEVRILIMLLIPDEEFIDPDMVIKIYEEILKACQNKKFIEELSKVRSYKEFLEINRKENF
ncbi:MAG: BglG family transcription antiterminator [Clostridiaceae bacterium]